MGQIKTSQPVKLFVGVIYSSSPVLERAEPALQNRFGEIDKESPGWNFDFTNYYEKEMGANLWRKFISFKRLINPEDLKEIKIYTNLLERELAQMYAPPIRPINLDPGYLALSKVVLATTKDYTHRLYLGDGIYGEVTLHYHHGKFWPYAWTYPDYQTGNYLEFFHELRQIYQAQLGDFQKSIYHFS